jgi:hypothetical protein
MEIYAKHGAGSALKSHKIHQSKADKRDELLHNLDERRKKS